MSTHLEDASFLNSTCNYDLSQVYRQALKTLKSILLPALVLHLSFTTLLAGEGVFLIFFAKTLAVMAFVLGSAFATLFTYLISLFYIQAKKIDRLVHFNEQFIKSCREHLLSESHLVLAEAIARLAAYLEGFESRLYPLSFLNQIGERLFRTDLFRIRKLLLQAAIEEHLHQIRLTPTDLEVHTSCARIYTLLSKLYRKAGEPWKQKADATEELAIQELHILNEYAPNDPWIYEQLEKGYARLGMQQQQLLALESLVRLRPQDVNILCRLGMLYFHAGLNAKGLQIYQTLKPLNFKKAEDLIQRYGHPNA